MNKYICIIILSFCIFSCKNDSIMIPANSKMFFLNHINSKNLSYDKLSLDQFIDEFTFFYKYMKTNAVDINNDGDMILVQWGVYDWGKGKYFEFNITRQFIENGKNGDDAISQLECTFYYPSNIIDNNLKGNRWFKNISEVDRIKDFIEKSDFYKIIKNITPVKRDIIWEHV